MCVCVCVTWLGCCGVLLQFKAAQQQELAAKAAASAAPLAPAMGPGGFPMMMPSSLSAFLPSWLPQATVSDDVISDLDFGTAVVVGVSSAATRRRGGSIMRTSVNLSSGGGTLSAQTSEFTSGSSSSGPVPGTTRSRLTSFRPWMRENQNWDG